jgi:ribosomal protein S27E
MAGVYRPPHPERTVLYRVLFHYFERLLAEYEGRFEREYGYFRPVVKEVVERYLDCGTPRCGFARIRCPDCLAEHLLMFSYRTRGFCPSCHAKRLEEWGRLDAGDTPTGCPPPPGGLHDSQEAAGMLPVKPLAAGRSLPRGAAGPGIVFGSCHGKRPHTRRRRRRQPPGRAARTSFRP